MLSDWLQVTLPSMEIHGIAKGRKKKNLKYVINSLIFSTKVVLLMLPILLPPLLATARLPGHCIRHRTLSELVFY